MLFWIRMYKTSFYTKPDGKSPVKEFLSKSNEVLRTKILRQIKYIQEFGLTHSIPNLKKISGTPLWEIRILGKDNVRIFCASLPNKEVKILHIIAKKKQKTPQKEIATALQRYKEITSNTA